MECLGTDLPMALEFDDGSFLPPFGRIHPSDLTCPSDVLEGCGALFDLACFGFPSEELLFDFFLCPRFSFCFLEGTRATEDCERRCESCSKVFIASIREAVERFTRA